MICTLICTLISDIPPCQQFRTLSAVPNKNFQTLISRVLRAGRTQFVISGIFAIQIIKPLPFCWQMQWISIFKHTFTWARPKYDKNPYSLSWNHELCMIRSADRTSEIGFFNQAGMFNLFFLKLLFYWLRRFWLHSPYEIRVAHFDQRVVYGDLAYYWRYAKAMRKSLKSRRLRKMKCLLVARGAEFLTINSHLWI